MWSRRAALLLVLAVAPALGGCWQEMRDRGRVKPYEGTGFFRDGSSVRHRPEGTIAREDPVGQSVLTTGLDEEGNPVADFPFPIGRADLERGRESFEIHCTPCHDPLGTGRGMIVRRGFKAPPSYDVERLVEAPAGHFVDVMTRGFGVMDGYREDIPPNDRWRIAAWIRVLQRARRGRVEDAPESLRERLGKEGR